MDKDTVLKQIADVLATVDAALGRHNGPPSRYSWNDEDIIEMVTLLRATVDRIAPPGSAYLKNADDIVKRYGSHHPTYFDGLLGIVKAMRRDYDAGHVQPLHELVHGDVFGDFLEMADHLLAEGYKDAAAVIAGSVLEEHLRQLAEKNGIAVIRPGGGPKRASAMNDELKAANVYVALDQKSVGAWLELRNNAAHGQYGKYVMEQVALMVQGIRDFITRRPA